ncbi:glycosyltransferase family 2 protein [Proteus vulgaris]|uniref:glycosyltransferase n=1 Tax=Proteus TaxID=583 RepID=UPI001377C859|nr:MULTISPECIES: glycosyltransferase [Proteus]MBG5986039.1 glycosyltransferase family 2 protein [Proteus vulgaris]NBN44405.1 glycosyltransferase [Proteus sp. G2626]
MLGLVILNYKTYIDTKELIFSLMKVNIDYNIKIFIVDNDSNTSELDNLKLALKTEVLDIIFIPVKSNIGFANGMNVGIEYARESGCEYIICSNSDILFPVDFSFSSLIKPYLSDNNVAMIGPRIQNLSGNEQNPLYINDPFNDTIKTKLIKFFLLIPFFGKAIYFSRGILKEYLMENKKKKNLNILENDDVYCLHGSFFLLTPSYFKYYFDLDKNTFLYFEELILAKRISSKNLISKLNTNVFIIHKEDSSTNFIFKNKKLSKKMFVLRENYKSFKYFCKNYLA